MIYKIVMLGAHDEAIKPIADIIIPRHTANRAPNDSTNEPLTNPKTFFS